MKRVYTEAQHEFLRSYIPGHTSAETVTAYTERFGGGMTTAKLKAYKGNYKLRSGTRKGIRAGLPTAIWPEDIRAYILSHKSECSIAELASRINGVFGTSYTYRQLRAFFNNHKVTNGRDTRIKKGNIPFNKGHKGLCAPGCEKSWFRKGSRPHNVLPVGSEVTDRDGYIRVKVSEPNGWKFKHRLVWENANGSIPSGHVITFRDGDKANCAIENLALITMAENSYMNAHDRRYVGDLFETGLLVARLAAASKSAEKRRKCNNDND